ncbi:MAG: aldo/keto reductase, partial [Firmicutes bacterium]|nr:aldo/keto reductase [Bacillota bacterium]
MKIQKVHLGNTGLSVSRAGFGVLPMGPAQLSLPVEEGADLLLYGMEAGFNFFDTAQYYQTYPYLRLAMKKWDARGHGAQSGSSTSSSDLVLSSKSLAPDYSGMMNAIEEARQQLNRDVIDIFLMHEVRTGQLPQRARAWEALLDARSRGLVRAIGLSTHHVNVAAAAASLVELDVVFPLLNYAGLGIRSGASLEPLPEIYRQDSTNLTAAQEAPFTITGSTGAAAGERFATADEMMKAIRACRAAGKGVYSMKAFGGGSLTVTYQKALDYVFSQPEVDSVMLGFGRESEIDDLINYMSGTMPSDYNPDISAKRVRVNQEDCEGCGACRAMCSAGAIFWNPDNGLAEVDQSKCLT